MAKILNSFWKRKKVLITGHTGFKGSWLIMYLKLLDAKIYGYALKPPTIPNLFDDNQLERKLEDNIISDIRDYEKVYETLKKIKPEIIIHMAAQPLVRDSYIIPRFTYETNVMGTVNILEAVRKYPYAMCVVIITTDKVYKNANDLRAYRECDELGGSDPYSSSKACSELVAEAYRFSYFNTNKPPFIATVRAGNVIGGGDWAKDRLIPDIIRALLSNKKIRIRNPHSIRPWQHVLEPLSGYLMLCERMSEEGSRFAQAWNFGPYPRDAKNVEWIVKRFLEKFANHKGYEVVDSEGLHEAKYLRLNSNKAIKELGWKPKWSIDKAIDKISEWVVNYKKDKNTFDVCIRQIEEYLDE